MSLSDCAEENNEEGESSSVDVGLLFQVAFAVTDQS